MRSAPTPPCERRRGKRSSFGAGADPAPAACSGGPSPAAGRCLYDGTSARYDTAGAADDVPLDAALLDLIDLMVELAVTAVRPS